MRLTVVVIGIIILSITAYEWTTALGNISEMDYAPGTPEDRMERVVEERINVNTTYGIWFGLTIVGTAAFYYIASLLYDNKKQKNSWQSEGKREVE